MEQQIKTIRIFISSTFKDMHSERDYLVKYVFPELKERCIKKGLSLVDVDLRWGVTEEEAEQGKSLEICLDEIENCRPFFIGILGERYGWSPENYQVSEYEKYDWLKKFEKGHSITALEIYHGVLNKKDMKPRAFFYFRNPSFSTYVPDSKQHEVKAESDISAIKLFHLKEDIKDTFKVHNIPGHIMEKYPCIYKGLKIDLQLIRDSLRTELTEQDINLLEKLIGKDNIIENKEYESLNEQQKIIVDKYSYVYLDGLEDFGSEVLENVWKAICEEHPENKIVTDPSLIEQAYHQRFMNSRTRMFIGREDILTEIAGYLCDTSVRKPLVVTGEPGTGKSAVMAIAAQLNQDGFSDCYNIIRFIGASPSSLDINKLVQGIISETISHFEIVVDEQRINDPNILYEYFKEVLFKASAKGKLTLFIDAVNQLLPQYDPSHLVWLPKYLPENVKIVISSIESEYSKNAIKYDLPFVQVGELTPDNCKKIIHDILKEYRKTLTEKQMEMVLNNADAKKPLYLKVACEELRIFPSFELINSRIAKLPNTITELFIQFLERLEADHSPMLVKDTLSFIESSMYGLLESELLELLKPIDKEKLPVNIWAKLYRNLCPYLMYTGDENEGLLEFFHQQLSFAVKTRYLKSEETALFYNKKLANYGWKNYRLKNGNTINTVLYTAIYLYKSNDKNTLYGLLEEIFTADNKVYSSYEGIAENLYDWVVNNYDYEHETILKTISEKLAENNFPYHFSTLLYTKGAILKDIGKIRWSLEFFENVLKVMEKLLAHEPSRQDFRRDLAASQSFIGQIYRSMGKGEEALSFFEKSVNVMEELVAHEPLSIDFRSDLGTSYGYIGQFYQLMGDKAKALSFFEKSLKVNEDLILLEPEKIGFRRDIATINSYVGQIYESVGEAEKALRFFDKSQLIMEELVEFNSTRIDFKITLYINYNNAGRIYKSIGNVMKAMELFEKSLKISEELVSIEPTRTDLIRDLSVSINNIGKIHQSTGAAKIALTFFEKSLKVLEELVVIEPSNTDFRRGLATCQCLAGQIFETLGEGNKALSLFEKQKYILEELVKLEPTKTDLKIDLAISNNLIGKVLLMMGETEKALVSFEESIKVNQEIIVLDPEKTESKSELALNLSLIGQLYESFGQSQKALTLYDKQKLILEELIVVEPLNKYFKKDIAMSYLNIGRFYQSIGEVDKTLIFYEKQQHILEELVAIEPLNKDFRRDLSVNLNNIGQIYQSKRELEIAQTFYEKQKLILEELVVLEPSNIDFRRELATSQNFIGRIFESKEELIKALAFFEKDLKEMENLVETEPTRADFRKDLAGSLSDVGRIYKSLGEFEKGVVFLIKSCKVMEEVMVKEPSKEVYKTELASCFYNVGKIYEEMSEIDNALIFYEKQILILEEIVAIGISKSDSTVDLSTILKYVSKIYESKGDIEKALVLYEKSLKVMEIFLTLDPSKIDVKIELSINYNYVGKIYESSGDMNKALEFYKKSLKVRNELADLEPARTDLKRGLSVTYNYMGSIYQSKGENSTALSCFENSLEIMEELVSSDPTKLDLRRELPMRFNFVGSAFRTLGEFNKARVFFEKSLKTLEQLLALESSNTDLNIEYAIAHWDIYTVSKEDEKLYWLKKTKNILEPIVERNLQHPKLIQLWGMVNKEENQKARSKALYYYEKGDYYNAKLLLEDLLNNNFEVLSTHVHLARLALITDQFSDLAKYTSEAWNMRNEAKNYVIARILWFKTTLKFLNKTSLEDFLGQLKTVLQNEDAFMEWTMNPVLDHIKPQISEQQHELLSALVDALSNKQNLEKLINFEEWRAAKPEELY